MAFVRRFRLIIKHVLLLLWRELPIPTWAKNFFLVLTSYKFIIGVLAVIVDDQGRLLLFRHTYIKDTPWGLPGGGAKRENLSAALQRELKEESNFLIQVNGPIAIVQTGRRQINYLFSCSLIEANFKPSVEVNDYGFYQLDDLPAIVPPHHTMIQALQSQAHKTQSWPRLDLVPPGLLFIAESS